MNHASRWSAVGLIGDPGPKTVLDEGRLSHGSVYEPNWDAPVASSSKVLGLYRKRSGRAKPGALWKAGAGTFPIQP